ncbi:MAG: hypothetical protein AB1805_03345 [Nitrospirota bacterium]
MMKSDILIFVEDPGAANYIVPLPEALSGAGYTVTLVAEGAAKDYLLQRGLRPFPATSPLGAEHLLKEFDPLLVITGTSENLDSVGLHLIDCAWKNNIQSIGIVDSYSNAAYRFRGRGDTAFTHAPGWLFVPDGWTKDAFVALGYHSDHIMVCGHPHYDHVLAVKKRLRQEGKQAVKRRVFPRSPEARPVVVFLAELSSGLNPQQYQRSSDFTLSGRGMSSGRTEIVMEEFLDAAKMLNPVPYKVLRLHPKNTLQDFSAYHGEFDLVSKDELPLEIVFAADLVVGMTSMLLFEAALMGIKTLSIVPRAEEIEWLASIRAGITEYVSTRDRLGSVLNRCFANCHGKAPADDEGKVITNAVGNIIGAVEKILLNGRQADRCRR